jgi:hypothetical protein
LSKLESRIEKEEEKKKKKETIQPIGTDDRNEQHNLGEQDAQSEREREKNKEQRRKKPEQNLLWGGR